MVEIYKNFLSLLKQYLHRKKDLPNMSKLRKEIFLVKIFLHKTQDKSQKMKFISFVFTEIWEKNWRGLKIFLFLITLFPRLRGLKKKLSRNLISQFWVSTAKFNFFFSLNDFISLTMVLKNCNILLNREIKFRENFIIELFKSQFYCKN